MRSSDQRYRHVQRQKRDTQEWEQWSKRLVIALRDARLGQGDYRAVEEAIRGGAAEFSHLLLACGRTATDFRRNYRVGSPNWHTVWANQICPVDTLSTERLDGYAVLRLSREQTKNVKLRWAKLREQDILIHDPQGTHWSKVMGCWLDGEREEHLGTLLDLRDRGISLVRENIAKGGETALERTGKEMMRYIGQLSHLTPDWYPAWSGERSADEARFAWFRVKRLVRDGVQKGQTAAEHRLEVEKALVVAEAFVAGGSARAAYYDPDTSGRHTRVQPRIDRLESAMGEVWRLEHQAYRARRQREREEAEKLPKPGVTPEQRAHIDKGNHRMLAMIEKGEVSYPCGSPEPERLRLKLIGTEWQRDYGPERWPIGNSADENRVREAV